MALNLKGFKKFMYKYITGGASVKIGKYPDGKDKYLGWPKTAHFMVPGITLMGVCQSEGLGIPALFVTGIVLTAIGFFSFFYPQFAPIKWEELDDEGKMFRVKQGGLEGLTEEQRAEYFEIKARAEKNK